MHGNLIIDKDKGMAAGKPQGLHIWYNERNQPVQMGDDITYRYNAAGQRYYKQAAGGEEYYVMDGDLTMGVFTNNGSGWQLQHWNIVANGVEGRINENGSKNYYYKDHLGSVRATVDELGTVIGYDDYYPFGLTMPGRSSNSANPNDDYKFTGHELDDEAGLNLYHAGARGYDPVLGRFLQVDPLHMERPGLSPFNYVQNNPVTRVDPTGMLDDYYIRENGNIDVIRTDDETDTFYYVDSQNQTTNLGTFGKNENGLIQLPGTYSINENGVSFGFSVKSGQGDKSFIAPEAFAAVLGAFAETGFSDFTITQFSNSDGSSPAPSISHINGRNGDFRYLRADGSGNPVTVFDGQFDAGRNANFTNALSKYGYSNLKSYHIPIPYRNAVALPNTSHLKGHHNHLHLQGFRPKINTTFYPYIR